MCDRQRLSLTGGLEGLGQRPVEDADRPSPRRRASRAGAADVAAPAGGHQQPTRLLSGVAKEAFKLRAEIVERSFAHNLDRGGMRRTWLRGRENVHNRYLLHVAGHNLSLLRVRQLDRRRHPARGRDRADMAVFSCCSRPPGPCWSHWGSRKAARSGFRRRIRSSGSETRKKPLNQRAAMPPTCSACPSRPPRTGTPPT